MGLIDLLFQRQFVGFKKDKIGFDVVTLDASLSESYSSTSEVTEHPVESGVKISDHVRRRPKEIKIDGVVSNTPNEIAASLRFDLGSVGIRAEEAYFKLIDLQEKGSRIVVSTSLRTFENMVILGIDLTRDVNNSNIARMSISLKELFTIDKLPLVSTIPLLELAAKKVRVGKRSLAVGLYTAGLAGASAGVTAALKAIRKART